MDLEETANGDTSDGNRPCPSVSQFGVPVVSQSKAIVFKCVPVSQLIRSRARKHVRRVAHEYCSQTIKENYWVYWDTGTQPQLLTEYRYRIHFWETFMKQTRLSQLSRPRRILIRLCQEVNHGQIRDLSIRGGEPLFVPPPTVLFDLKLSGDDGVRPESELDDYDLQAEICRLLQVLDQVPEAQILQLEIRSGIPRRCLLSDSAMPDCGGLDGRGTRA